MSLKNLPIVIGFAVITSVQFAVGMYMMSLTAREGGEAELFVKNFVLIQRATGAIAIALLVAQAPPPIPDALHLCLFSRHRDLEVASISISLFFGTRELFSI